MSGDHAASELSDPGKQDDEIRSDQMLKPSRLSNLICESLNQEWCPYMKHYLCAVAGLF